MKKKVIIPITLLACASLLIGCGGKKEKESSVQPEPVSSSSEEPIPGPGPEIEDTVVLPKTLDEAHFIDMGNLSQEVPQELLDSSVDEVDFEDIHFASGATLSAEWEFSFSGDFAEYQVTEADFRIYNDGISISRENKSFYYNYEGVANYLYNFSEEETTYISKENKTYKKNQYIADEDVRTYEWSILPANQDPAKAVYEELIGQIYFYNQPAYTKIGDYIYVVSFTSRIDSDISSNYHGEEFIYTYKYSEEVILRLDTNYQPAEMYYYYEGTVDHNMTTGVSLKEPKLVSRDLYHMEMGYGEYQDHPEAQQILNSIPDKYFVNAYFDYRLAAASVGEDGKLTAAPSFGSATLWRSGGFYDYETPYLSFFPYYNTQYFAIELVDLYINYINLVNNGEINRTVSMKNNNFMAKVAEAMNGQLLDYGGNTYLVVNINTYHGVEFLFNSFNFSGLNDIVVREITNYLIFY